MQEIDELWGRIVAGQRLEHPLKPHEERALFTRVERAAHAPEAEERRAALRVAMVLGGREAVAALSRFVADPDLGVRKALFEHAFDLRDDGLLVFRELAADPDLDLALASLAILRKAVDRAATRRLRLLLDSPLAPVRAAAVELLGHVGGPTVRPEVERLLGDDDDAVRAEAAAALERIAGRQPKAQPERWYPEPAPTENALMAGSGEPAPARKKILVPGRAPPIDRAGAEALLRRLGAATAEERPRFEAELRAMGDAALGVASLGWRSGGDPELGRGIAYAAELLGLASWATTLRRLLGDSAAGVREAGALALGRLGKGTSVLTALAKLLTDPEARVRIAAITAIGRLCQTLGRPDLVRQRLAPLERDPDEGVRKARTDVLAALGS